jgi:hypothetical protein
VHEQTEGGKRAKDANRCEKFIRGGIRRVSVLQQCEETDTRYDRQSCQELRPDLINVVVLSGNQS